MEAIWGFGASADALARRVTFENRDLVDSAREARQSVVLLTPHFCNWEWLLPAGGAYFGLPIDAVYQKQRVDFLDTLPARRAVALRRQADRPRGFRLRADESRRDAARLCADRRPDAAARRPEALVAFPEPRYGVLHRRRKGRALPRFTGVVRGDAPRRPRPLFGAGCTRSRCPRSIRSVDDTPIMERFARMLEAAVRESPADWLWLQKRWKYPKTEEPERRRAPPPVAPHVDRVRFAASIRRLESKRSAPDRHRREPLGGHHRGVQRPIGRDGRAAALREAVADPTARRRAARTER